MPIEEGSLDLQDIRTLVARGEGPSVEFKATTGGLKDAMRTLCGFLKCSSVSQRGQCAASDREPRRETRLQTWQEQSPRTAALAPPPHFRLGLISAPCPA